jgi:hypothetical protein
MDTRGILKMNIQAMSFNEIRRTGIEALTEKLGTVGMVRFLQQNETGYGDYTKDREEILGNPSLEEIYNSMKNNNKI